MWPYLPDLSRFKDLVNLLNVRFYVSDHGGMAKVLRVVPRGTPRTDVLNNTNPILIEESLAAPGV